MPAGFTILAFDLFVGTWEVRDAQSRGISHWLVIPCLIFTFMLGPIGLLMYYAVRLVKQKRLRQMLSEVWKHERRLMLAAAVLFTLSLLLVGGMIFDNAMILGVNRWLKPFKFAVSIAIYLGTLAFYLTLSKVRIAPNR